MQRNPQTCRDGETSCDANMKQFLGLWQRNN